MLTSVFTSLRNYTKERKEYRLNALIFKHRGYQRKLIYLWKVVSNLLDKFDIGDLTKSYQISTRKWNVLFRCLCMDAVNLWS